MDEKTPVLTIGTNRCQCSGCGRFFGGVSAFDRHQKIAKDGSAICLDPAERGMVYRSGWWGQVGPDKHAFSGIGGRPSCDDDPGAGVVETMRLWE